jgi:hypothetical protein
MSETYTPAGNVGSSFQRATVGEAATGTHGQEFMRDDITKFADKTRFLSDAGFYTASKVQFPATQVPDGDPNALDDYEEGVWTPVLGGATSESGQTYATQLGRYVKIGQLVIATFSISLSVPGTITGNATLKGLPFTALAGGDSVAALGYFDLLGIAVVALTAYLLGGGTTLSFSHRAAAAATGTASANTLFQSGTPQISGVVVYRASA